MWVRLRVRPGARLESFRGIIPHITFFHSAYHVHPFNNNNSNNNSVITGCVLHNISHVYSNSIVRSNNNISAVLYSRPKGEMRSPSSTLLTPIRRRCSQTLLSIMFKVCCFVLVDKQIIYDYVSVISGFEEQLVLSNLTACCNSVVYLFQLQCLLSTAVC